ncbi:hypothetical protein RRG08_028935 [Elysia crispata]|uniref:Uncharacterized protein n=1 Tax=Elysia crispata TaxID=231223 RepID=A0AAE1AS75_9GAST|nr:hypothetical protein RRG08_028935 [Elysia crispata]
MAYERLLSACRLAMPGRGLSVCQGCAESMGDQLHFGLDLTVNFIGISIDAAYGDTEESGNTETGQRGVGRRSSSNCMEEGLGEEESGNSVEGQTGWR